MGLDKYKNLIKENKSVIIGFLTIVIFAMCLILTEKEKTINIHLEN